MSTPLPTSDEVPLRGSRRSPHLGSQLTVVFLLSALTLGCLVMGGARTWILLPILLLLTLALGTQGIRVLSQSAPLAIPRFDWIDASVLGFLLYSTALWLTAPAEYVARQEYFVIAGCAIVFWTARYGISSRAHVLVILGGVLFVIAGVTAFAFYLKANPDFLPYGEKLHQYYAPRITGTYGCPNHLGYLLVLGIGIALSLVIYAELPWFIRIVCVYFVGMMTVAVLMTQSRGTFLGYGAALLAMGFWLVRSSKMKLHQSLIGLAGATALAALGLYLSPGALARITGLSAHFNGTAPLGEYVRIKLANDALKIIADHPWFGTGPGTFLYIHPRYHGPDYGSLAVYTHNDYLNFAADYGLLAVPFALLFIGGVTWKLTRPPRSHWEWSHHAARFSALAAWGAIVIHSVVDFNLHIPANAFLVFTLTGLGLRASRTHDSSSAHASRPVGIILGSALLLIGISFGFLVVRSSQGYYPYYFAYENRTLQPLEKSIQQTEAGFEKDPQSPFSAGFLGDLYRSQANALKPGPERNALAQSAANWYLKASELNPWDDSLRIRQGMVDDLMGRFEEASLYYAAAIRQQPYNGFYYIALGAHYWRRGLLDESNKAYNRAANCAIGQQEAREALELLQEIIRKNGLKVETEPGIEQPHATLP